MANRVSACLMSLKPLAGAIAYLPFRHRPEPSLQVHTALKRRQFLRIITGGLIAAPALTGCVAKKAPTMVEPVLPPQPRKKLASLTVPVPESPRPKVDDAFIKDYLHKMRNFDEDHLDDIMVEPHEQALLISVVDKLSRVQEHIGHGNFYLLGFDQALSMGGFSKAEAEFMDKVFHRDASEYGFYGEKPLTGLTDDVDKKRAYKVPYTGNWLYRDGPVERYEEIRSILGDSVILTSGVRSIVKQFYLFLHKAMRCNGNLSRASRSLAPPGYSFHGVGDFDVGQKGFGPRNFTAEFTRTEVFQKLNELGYITLRYPKDNLLGVRFEPWHIKMDNKV